MRTLLCLWSVFVKSGGAVWHVRSAHRLTHGHEPGEAAPCLVVRFLGVVLPAGHVHHDLAHGGPPLALFAHVDDVGAHDAMLVHFIEVAHGCRDRRAVELHS
jgi:hypothetical protein